MKRLIQAAAAASLLFVLAGGTALSQEVDRAERPDPEAAVEEEQSCEPESADEDLHG